MRHLAVSFAVLIHALAFAQWDTLRFSSSYHQLEASEVDLFASGSHEVLGVQHDSKWTRTTQQAELNHSLTDRFGMVPEAEFLKTRTYLVHGQPDSCALKNFRIDLASRYDGMTSYPWWGLFHLPSALAECLQAKGVRPYEGRFLLVMHDQKLVALRMPSKDERRAIEDELVAVTSSKAVRPMKFWREDREVVTHQGVRDGIDSIEFVGFSDLVVKDDVVNGTEVWSYHSDTIRITDVPVVKFDLGSKAPRQEVIGHVDLYGRPDQWQFLFAPTHEKFLRDVSGATGTWWAVAQFLGRPWIQGPDKSWYPPTDLESHHRYYTHDPTKEIIAAEKERVAREKAAKEQDAAERAALISKYGPTFGAAIQDGNLVVGMTKEMVDLASRRLFTVESTSWQNGKEVVKARHVLGARMTIVFSKEGKLLEFRTE